MLTLHGSPISNYYNKVKLALLEKSVDFKESHTMPHGTDPAMLQHSPLGKIPFITTEQGGLCESQHIMEWIEATWPNPPLLPSDAVAAAKVRELTTFVDWHVEIVARQLYHSAFFDGPPLTAERKESIRQQLSVNIAAFKRLARFGPYVAGNSFTQADCAAFNHLPIVARACRKIFGVDLLEEAGIDHKGYVSFLAARPSAGRVIADRKNAIEAN
jgi:glutathione S-transferase